MSNELSNQTKGQIAKQNIAWATVEIQACEARPNPDVTKISKLYALRLREIIKAMRAGVTADEIASITGVGKGDI